jgi:hypothetical protein
MYSRVKDPASQLSACEGAGLFLDPFWPQLSNSLSYRLLVFTLSLMLGRHLSTFCQSYKSISVL